MLTNTKLPKGSELVLAYQRIYQHPISLRMQRIKSLRRIYERYFMSFVEGGRGAEMAKLYEKDINREIKALEPYLPAKADRILDIGCGMGGISGRQEDAGQH